MDFEEHKKELMKDWRVRFFFYLGWPRMVWERWKIQRRIRRDDERSTKESL